MRFSFGKYRGREIQDVLNTDRKYLTWLATEFVSSKKSVATEIELIRTLVADDIREAVAREAVLKEQRKLVYAPVVKIFGGACMKQAIKRGTQISTWVQSIITSLHKGDKLSIRAQEIINDMCGKGSGRRNSKAYRETFDQVHQAFQLANQIDATN
jgi:uncharacterized protein (DUF3820 family)